MKKIILVVILCMFCAWTGNAQKVNEKVEIESKGAWYPGTILKVNAAEGKYFITYEGWDEGWNEWVTIDRLRNFATETPKAPLTKFAVGNRVEVEYGMVPEPARIISVGENKYEIEYDNKLFGKKWVTEKQIKKL